MNNCSSNCTNLHSINNYNDFNYKARPTPVDGMLLEAQRLLSNQNSHNYLEMKKNYYNRRPNESSKDIKFYQNSMNNNIYVNSNFQGNANHFSNEFYPNFIQESGDNLNHYINPMYSNMKTRSSSNFYKKNEIKNNMNQDPISYQHCVNCHENFHPSDFQKSDVFQSNQNFQDSRHFQKNYSFPYQNYLNRGQNNEKYLIQKELIHENQNNLRPSISQQSYKFLKGFKHINYPPVLSKQINSSHKRCNNSSHENQFQLIHTEGKMKCCCCACIQHNCITYDRNNIKISDHQCMCIQGKSKVQKMKEYNEFVSGLKLKTVIPKKENHVEVQQNIPHFPVKSKEVGNEIFEFMSKKEKRDEIKSSNINQVSNNYKENQITIKSKTYQRIREYNKKNVKKIAKKQKIKMEKVIQPPPISHINRSRH